MAWLVGRRTNVASCFRTSASMASSSAVHVGLTAGAVGVGAAGAGAVGVAVAVAAPALAAPAVPVFAAAAGRTGGGNPRAAALFSCNSMSLSLSRVACCGGIGLSYWSTLAVTPVPEICTSLTPSRNCPPTVTVNVSPCRPPAG